jgi:hypothetical protein
LNIAVLTVSDTRTEETDKSGKFKLCGTGLGLSLAAASIILPAIYLFGSVFFGEFFNQAPIFILALITVAIFLHCY